MKEKSVFNFQINEGQKRAASQARAENIWLQRWWTSQAVSRPSNSFVVMWVSLFTFVVRIALLVITFFCIWPAYVWPTSRVTPTLCYSSSSLRQEINYDPELLVLFYRPPSHMFAVTECIKQRIHKIHGRVLVTNQVRKLSLPTKMRRLLRLLQPDIVPRECNFHVL